MSVIPLTLDDFPFTGFPCHWIPGLFDIQPDVTGSSNYNHIRSYKPYNLSLTLTHWDPMPLGGIQFH